MKKKYKIDWNFEADVIVEIDHEVMTEEMLHDINRFWSDDEDRLDENGSPLHGILKLLTNVVLSLQVEYRYNTQGIIGLFNYDEKSSGQEGWPKMDGSAGIKLIRVDEVCFDDHQMSVEVMA